MSIAGRTALGCLLFCALLSAGDPPPRPATHELKNGDWTLLVALPDANHPWFQRQLRFDWSGLVVHARWKDTTLIGSPAKEDGLPGLSLGTSDEFKNLLPVSASGTAGPVAKIGIGILGWDAPPPGSRKKPQRVLDRATHQSSSTGATGVGFVQEQEPEGGIGWRLEKRVDLLPDGAGFRISRRLLNTGTSPIVTQWYCHHWFRPGGGGGPGTTVTWPFEPTVEWKDPATGELAGGMLTLKPWKGAFYATITGFRSPADNQARVRRADSPVAFGFRGDWTPPKHALYVMGDICPEPFLDLDLAPGQEQTWATEHFVETP